MTKAELRREYKARRAALTATEYDRRNRKIFQLFRKNFPLTQPTTVHCYLASIKKRETDTSLIIEYLLENDTFVVTSRSHANGRLSHHRLTTDTKLEKNQWNITEPLATEPTVDVEKIDWVLVPLLAFDYRGYRVGYGQGYYDRFLAQCRPDVLTVGLSLEPPVDCITDTDLHDVTLDQVITPYQIFSY
ncbi:MAG: 5-formyltetrahydrofolate cyclo-ligase [Bacteroidota bacterium]